MSVLLNHARLNRFNKPDENGVIPEITMTGTRRRGDWGADPELIESLRKAGKIEAKVSISIFSTLKMHWLRN
jgi:hypothetical protein